jgi:uncharacterized protein (DUF305 family)
LATPHRVVTVRYRDHFRHRTGHGGEIVCAEVRPQHAGFPGPVHNRFQHCPVRGHRITFFVRRPNEILFLQLMIRHHQGGIDMAASAPRETRNDAVRVTALAPVDGQTQELQIAASN